MLLTAAAAAVALLVNGVRIVVRFGLSRSWLMPQAMGSAVAPKRFMVRNVCERWKVREFANGLKGVWMGMKLTGLFIRI